MEIKKANMNLLLGKIRKYLDTQPDAMKKGKKFVEAEKALTRLEKVSAEEFGKLELVPCRKNQPVLGG